MPRKTDEAEHEKRIQVARLWLRGVSCNKIHQETGIARTTLKRWFDQEPEFQRILVTLRDQIQRETAGAICDLLPRALEVVETALEEGDTKVAMQLLTASGALQSGGRALGMEGKAGGAADPTRIVVNVVQGSAHVSDSGINDDRMRTIDVNTDGNKS